MSSDAEVLDGGCACGEVRYAMHGRPMFVHCCHCKWCQRETGSAFVLNALIESGRIEITKGDPQAIVRPSESGAGQTVWQCSTCGVVLWSTYKSAGDALRFLRAGTLDDTAKVEPDIHIFTTSKQPWVRIPDGARAVPEFYSFKEEWPAESLARFKAAREKAAKAGD